jgi:hypothetical protein
MQNIILQYQLQRQYYSTAAKLVSRSGTVIGLGKQRPRDQLRERPSSGAAGLVRLRDRDSGK